MSAFAELLNRVVREGRVDKVCAQERETENYFEGHAVENNIFHSSNNNNGGKKLENIFRCDKSARSSGSSITALATVHHTRIYGVCISSTSNPFFFSMCEIKLGIVVA